MSKKIKKETMKPNDMVSKKVPVINKKKKKPDKCL